MNIFKELFAKLHIAREHMTSEYRLQRRIDSLEDKLLLLMDNSLDITKIKPATGRARLRQEISVQILRIVDAVATRNGIPYWLDFGTLLGAIRHQGFIPWDDDVDISMPRDAMNEFIAHKDELPKSISMTTDTVLDFKANRVLHIFETRSACFVDIFPYDLIKGAIYSSGEETEWARLHKKAFDEAVIAERQGRLFNFRDEWMAAHPMGEGDVDGFSVGLDYANAEQHYRNIFDVSKVFPLRRVEYEGYRLCVPADAEACLRQTYGDFMRFPKDVGTQKHSIFDHALSTIELRKILDELSQEIP